MAELFNINAFTHIAFRFFKIVGFNPLLKDSVDEPRITWIIEKLKSFYSSLVVLCLLINQVFTIIYVILNVGDLKKVVNALPPLGVVGLVAIKKYSITRKCLAFNNVLKKLNEMFPQSQDDQEKFQVKKYLKRFSSIQNIYGKSYIFSLVLFTFVPFLNYFMTGVWMHKIPVEIWFPFDPYENLLNFNFVLVWHFVVYFLVSSYFLGTDFICYALITVVEMYFNNLKNDLINLKDSIEIGRETKLKEIIERHNNLISISKDLEMIFSPGILLSFVTSSFLICLISVQILFVTENLEFIKFLGVLITTIAQVFLLCYFGDQLSCSSAGVADGAYNSACYDSRDSKFKLAMQMIIVRAQRPSKLTAMGFSTVCLESFCTVSCLINFISFI